MQTANLLYKIKDEDELKELKKLLEAAPMEIGFLLEASRENNEIYGTQVTLTPVGTDRILRDHIRVDASGEIEEFQSNLATMYVVTYQHGDKKVGILVMSKGVLRQLKSGIRQLIHELMGEQPSESGT